MSGQPKIDPDVIADHFREQFRIAEDMGDYLERPDITEEAARYVINLIAAARGLAQSLEKSGVAGLHTAFSAKYGHGHVCDGCGQYAKDWRCIDHTKRCGSSKATTALLALEALLPTVKS